MNKLSTLFLASFMMVSHSVCTAENAKNVVRQYWIAAEKVRWNYVPTGKNLLKPKQSLGIWGNQRIYLKYRYIQYFDGSFRKKVPQPRWMGILGPQIRAVQGDTIKVHFYNRTDKPLSIHPHGLHYDKASEGADGKGRGAQVPAGKKFTYIWTVDQNAAPGSSDPSSIVWLYHSHVDSVTEVYDGLIGTIIVTKKGMARSTRDPRPRDIDHAFTTLFMVFDENGRVALDTPRVKLSKADTEEGHLKHTINGYLFGNLRGLVVKKGQRVRWHLVGMGTEVDIHTAHWHGETVLERGHRTDVVELLPASMKTVDMVADNVGDWLFHCHVTDHITAGMMTRWHVKPR